VGWSQSKERSAARLSIRDAPGVPVRILVTAGIINDCTKATELIENIDTNGLIADCGYDTNEIVSFAIDANMQVVIPPKKNRKEQRPYDEPVYKLRHLVENAFCVLKRWRGIATRFAKNTASFLAAV